MLDEGTAHRVLSALLAAALLVLVTGGAGASGARTGGVDLPAAKRIGASGDFSVSAVNGITIYYTEGDYEYAGLLRGIAERWTPVLLKEFELEETPRITIIIYPEREAMYRDFGYRGASGAEGDAYGPLGAYSEGLIAMLSPSERGIWGGGAIDEAAGRAPVLHELSHLFLDIKTNGNYKEWFSEGCALYYEAKYLGNKPASAVNTPRVSFRELSDGFKYLNERERYRKSYAIIEYIVRLGGEQALKNIYNALEAGKAMNTALKTVAGGQASALDKL